MKKSFLSILLVGLVFFGFYFFKGKKEASLDDCIVVGTNAEYSPFSFIDNDKIVGFDINLIEEVSRRLGKKIRLVDMPFDVLIPEIQRGSIHVIAAGITPTPERAKELLFTDCYFTGDPLVIVSLRDKPLKTVEDLTNKDVIVNEGYTADFYLSSINGPRIKRLPNPAAAFLALSVGRADAFVAALSTVSPFLRQHKDNNFIVTPIKETEEKYAIAVSRSKSNLLSQFNSILSDIKNDGFLDKLKSKWGLY